MKVYELRQCGEKGGGLIVDNLGYVADVMGGIEYEEVGNKYILEIKEMNEEEFNNLPEWDGF